MCEQLIPGSLYRVPYDTEQCPGDIHYGFGIAISDTEIMWLYCRRDLQNISCPCAAQILQNAYVVYGNLQTKQGHVQTVDPSTCELSEPFITIQGWVLHPGTSHAAIVNNDPTPTAAPAPTPAPAPPPPPPSDQISSRVSFKKKLKPGRHTLSSRNATCIFVKRSRTAAGKTQVWYTCTFPGSTLYSRYKNLRLQDALLSANRAQTVSVHQGEIKLNLSAEGGMFSQFSDGTQQIYVPSA
mgnify:CR=1 FL=1